MKKIITLLLIISSCHIASAQWWGSGKRVKGNGDVITKTYETSNYDSISVNNSLDVELVEGTEG